MCSGRACVHYKNFAIWLATLATAVAGQLGAMALLVHWIIYRHDGTLSWGIGLFIGGGFVVGLSVHRCFCENEAINGLKPA